MRTRYEVSDEKLRGGFYSPKPLVKACLDRVAALTQLEELRLLEPSAGDGAFLRGLDAHPIGDRLRDILAVELVASEADKCRSALCSRQAQVVTGSFLAWAQATGEKFDIAVGNPPFVRFQFVGDDDKRLALEIMRMAGLPFRRVSNLWIPVTLGALLHLRAGGVFAFIIPSECLTGVSAGLIREWLLKNVDELQVEMFPPGTFPEVLQQVVVLSGKRRTTTRLSTHAPLRFVDYLADGRRAKSWSHSAAVDTHTWTRYLLSPSHLDAYTEATRFPAVERLGALAKIEVSTVTGANDFFCVTTSQLREYDLSPWSVPLLSRIRHAKGLTFAASDYSEVVASEQKAHLLYFDGQAGDALEAAGPARYLATGIAMGIDRRYKCRIRRPWYRVPLVKPGQVLLSKRSHRFPRLVLNDAQVATTDTIYQGFVSSSSRVNPAALVAGFHNSLTLLSCEIEGRSFGGGVLELVPSEIARVAVPNMPAMGAELSALDSLARLSTDATRLVDNTDQLLSKLNPDFEPARLEQLRDAYSLLSDRRLERSEVPVLAPS